MSTPELPRGLPDELSANREELRRRARAERVRTIWLWFGILPGPIGLVMVRAASDVLLAHDCSTHAVSHVFGLSAAQAVTAGITLLAILLALAAGIVSWRIWRQTSLPEDEVTNEEMPRVPFWALGGMLVSGFCLFAIAYTGGLALVLGSNCPQ